MPLAQEVSVILPALIPDSKFQRCIAAIRAAFTYRIKYEIICVVRDINLFDAYYGDDIKYLEEDYPSIYGAMNNGLKEAKGRYLYFIGQDDILLPCSANAIIDGMNYAADMILANVFYGGYGVYKNRRSRTSLVWSNWCHQGILYDRIKFINTVKSYPVEFKTQADHYSNIVFSGIPNIKILKYTKCIAWYSSEGYSSQFKDNVFRDKFPKIVLQNFGYFQYVVVVVRRIILKLIAFLGS